VTDVDTSWALMAYLGQFLVGVIAPVVVYMVKHRSSRFLAFHTTQALNVAVAAMIVAVPFFLLGAFVSDVFFAPWLIYVGVVMFFLVKAGQAVTRAERYDIPTFVAWPLLKHR
jgi:uncharacterized Tic20 family protein